MIFVIKESIQLKAIIKESPTNIGDTLSISFSVTVSVTILNSSITERCKNCSTMLPALNKNTNIYIAPVRVLENINEKKNVCQKLGLYSKVSSSFIAFFSLMQ